MTPFRLCQSFQKQMINLKERVNRMIFFMNFTTKLFHWNNHSGQHAWLPKPKQPQIIVILFCCSDLVLVKWKVFMAWDNAHWAIYFLNSVIYCGITRGQVVEGCYIPLQAWLQLNKMAAAHTTLPSRPHSSDRCRFLGHPIKGEGSRTRENRRQRAAVLWGERSWMATDGTTTASRKVLSEKRGEDGHFVGVKEELKGPPPPSGGVFSWTFMGCLCGRINRLHWFFWF